MAAPIVYTVLSEFKFEVGQAIASSQAVQSAVDGISQSADRALESLKGLGLGFVAQFGLGTTSVIGVLGQALKASDNLFKSQLTFSNIISANMHNMTGDIDTFNDRMMISRDILRQIAKEAITFGLPEQEFADMTKMMAAILTPKGLAGTNFQEARDMSRNLLKSAPSLGVHPAEVQGQLIRMLEGQAGAENTLFRRLAAETKSFQETLAGAGNAAQKFNRLPLKERFELVQKGLSQFSSDMDVLAGNAQTIGAMMRIIRDLFVGFNGILVPLGNALSGPLRQGFQTIVKVLNNEVRNSIEVFAGILTIFVQDVEQTTVNLMQARRLGADFRASSFTLIGVTFLSWVAGFIKLRGVLIALAIPLGLVATLIGGLFFILWKLRGVIMFVAGAAIKFGVAMLPILAFFQTISRAMAIAKLNDLKAVPAALEVVSNQFRKLSSLFMVVFGPALNLMDMVARKISFIFEYSFWLGVASSALKKFTDHLVFFFANLRGVIFAISGFLQGQVWSNGGMLRNFREGRQDFFEEYNRRTQDESGQTRVAHNVTNIAKVEINNQFKEQMEPDRIAFTLRDVLLKAAQNPQQAFGRSYSGAFAGP